METMDERIWIEKTMVYDDFMKTGDGDTLKEREGGKDR